MTRRVLPVRTSWGCRFIMNRPQMHTTMPLAIALIIMLTGCGSDEGPDVLSSHGQYAEGELGCAACHSIATGSRRQIVGPGGDFDRISHHVIDYSNRNNAIVSDADCLVCHDLGAHGSGTIWLNHKDNAGQVVVVRIEDPALSSGVIVGDLVVGINGRKVQSLEEFLKAARSVMTSRGQDGRLPDVVLTLNRLGRPLVITVPSARVEASMRGF